MWDLVEKWEFHDIMVKWEREGGKQVLEGLRGLDLGEI